MKIETVRIVPVDGPSDMRWVHWLNNQIFPDDRPPNEPASWILAFIEKEPIAFGGHQFLGDGVGFHYRAGVMPGARGKGIQKALIVYREAMMIRAVCKLAVTYTEVYSAASMRSFWALGYRPFEADEQTGSRTAGDCWKRMVHWSKDL